MDEPPEPESPAEMVGRELDALGISRDMLAANPFKLFLLGYLLGRSFPTNETTVRFITHNLYEGEADAHRDDHGREHAGVDDPAER